VTWRISGTNTQETLEAMLIPIAGTEETDISKWLNMIIDLFSGPSPLRVSNPKSFGPAVPKGWDGLCLALSMAKASSTGHCLTQSMSKVLCEIVADCCLCSWSLQHTTKPVENSHLNIEPNIVFCSQLVSKLGFAWHNIISFLKLTFFPYITHLQWDITHKLYAVFTS
jgi:hypothetical protein